MKENDLHNIQSILYNCFMDNFPHAMYLKDSNLFYSWCNSRFSDIINLPAQQIAGKSDHDLFPNDQATRDRLDDRYVIENDELMEFETKITDKQGPRSMHCIKMPVKNRKGEIYGIMGVLCELHELASWQQVSQALDQERNIFIKGPVVVFKWKNEENWPVEYVSPNVKDVLGYPVADWVSGRISYADCIVPEELERVASEVNSASKSDAIAFNHEPYQILCKDGHKIWVDDYTTILRNESGNITHYLGYIIDISERKRLIFQLEDKADELEKANVEIRETTAMLIQKEKLSALGELVAGVAHELNQPLNGIKIICQSLIRDLQKDRLDAEECKIDLEEVVQQVNRMSEIIDHMRLYSRQSEEIPVELVDINKIVKGPLKIIGQQLIVHHVLVEFELSEELPQIHANPNRLEQVMMNLITNARNACQRKEDGLKKIILGTSLLKDNESPLGIDSICITVTDTGVGISEKTAEKLFQPFFTTSEPGQGTGLGLSISKSIVEEHDGLIDFESTQGRGTTFRVILPAS